LLVSMTGLSKQIGKVMEGRAAIAQPMSTNDAERLPI
jgi:hypothetical protein